MKTFAKVVAVLMALSLGAVPSFAAIPCVAGIWSQVHHGPCCHTLANPIEGRSADGMTAMSGAVLNQPSCCKVSSPENVASGFASEVTRPDTQAPQTADPSIFTPIGSASSPQEIWTSPERGKTMSVQILLCTFRI